MPEARSSSESPGHLQIEVQERGAVTVVQLSGSAKMDVAGELWERLVKLIQPDTALLILDLSQLNFITSVGLGGIIAAHLRASQRGAVVKLVRPKPAILDLLSVTKLTKLFAIHDSVEAAIKAGSSNA